MMSNCWRKALQVPELLAVADTEKKSNAAAALDASLSTAQGQFLVKRVASLSQSAHEGMVKTAVKLRMCFHGFTMLAMQPSGS